MTAEEVAAALNMSLTTLKEHYAEEIEKGGQVKRAEIIMQQFKAASNGNVTAQKYYLQRGDHEFAPETKPEQPLGKKEQALADAKQVPDTHIGAILRSREQQAKAAH